MGREVEYPLSAEAEANLEELLRRINQFRWKYGKPMRVNSGYRPGRYNEAVGGAKNSAHVTCQAVDFSDPGREITNFILSNPSVLIECDLYMEAPEATPTWVHLQTRPTKNRIFKP